MNIIIVALTKYREKLGYVFVTDKLFVSASKLFVLLSVGFWHFPKAFILVYIVYLRIVFHLTYLFTLISKMQSVFGGGT